MLNDDETLTTLKSIDLSLRTLVAIARAREERTTATPGAPKKTTKAPALVATDADLDDPKWGDPEVRFMPRDWTGEGLKGRKFSQCPPEFLDLMGEALDYLADKSEEQDERTTNDKPVAPFKRKDAARARGWAMRNRRAGGPTPDQAKWKGWE